MKFIPYLKYVLLLLGLGIFLGGLASYDSEQELVVTSGLNLLFTYSAAILVASVVAAICMPLIGIIQNPKKSLSSFLGIVVLTVIFLVAYGMSSGEPIVLASGEIKDSIGELKFADTSIYAMYITFAVTLVTMVVTEIYKLFK